MSSGKKYIIAHGGKTKLSDVVNDCNLSICVDTKPGEPLSSILQKICANIKKAEGIYIEAGENVQIDGSGTKTSPYIVSATSAISSIGLKMPVGFKVEGSPLTKSGEINVTTELTGIIRGVAGSFSTVGIGYGLDFTNGILSSSFTSGEGIAFDGSKIVHGNTSNITNYLSTGPEVISSIEFDSFGHVVNITKRNIQISDFNISDDIGEIAQDAVYSMLNNGLHPNIVYNYNDFANTLDVTLNLDGNSIWQAVNDVISGGNGIVLNSDVSQKKLTISVQDSYIRSLLSDDNVIKYDSLTGVIGLEDIYKSRWETAYNDSIVAASISGSTNKVLTLTTRGGQTLNAPFTDLIIVDDKYPNSLTFTNGELVIGVENGEPLSTIIPLSKLHDVKITGLANNDLLRYNSTTQKWENWKHNFLTSYNETDPIFKASPAYWISGAEIQNWNYTYQKHIKSATITGDVNKVLTIVLHDGSLVTAPFEDLVGLENYVISGSFEPLTGNVVLKRNNDTDIVFSLDGRYLQSYTETDPIFVASPAYTITDLNINQWKTSYNEDIVDIYVTGTTSKTITLTRRDGSTLSAIFEDLIGDGTGGPGDCVADGNNYVTSIGFTAGTFTLNRLGMSSLTTTISLSQLLDVSFTALEQGQILMYNSTSGVWENKVAPYLTSFTENDPVANSKIVTINQGTGIIVSGFASQSVGSNPTWTLSFDKSYTDTFYVPLTRNISINGIQQNLNSDRSWTLTTSNIVEGTNLYFTNARVWSAISGTAPISVINGVVSHNVSNVTSGNYNNVTIDSYGHVTAGSNIPYITSAAIATLTDVTLSGLQNNQVLQYDVVSGKWINKNLPVPVDTNFANTDLTATGNRTHNFNGYDFVMNNLKGFSFNTLNAGLSNSYISSTVGTDVTLSLGVSNSSGENSIANISKSLIDLTASFLGQSAYIKIGNGSIDILQSSGNYTIANVQSGSSTDSILTLGTDNNLKKISQSNFLLSTDPRIVSWDSAAANEIVGIVVNDVTADLKRIVLTQKDGGTLTADFVDNSLVYTDENAQDAVGNILEDTDSIDVEYNDETPYIRVTLKDEYVFNLLRKTEVRFYVGTEGYPQVGETSFYLKDCNGNILTNKKIDFFRERVLEWEGDDYTYNAVTGLITVVNPFRTGERCLIKVEDVRMWQRCEGTPSTNYLLINSTDVLLINDTDSFVL